MQTQEKLFELETQEMPATDTCIDCGCDLSRDGAKYGIDADTGHKVCYACCGYRDKGKMIEDGYIVLYLSVKTHGNGDKPYRGILTLAKAADYELINWPGSLRIPVTGVSKSRHNFGCVRTDVWFVGPDGYIWWGKQIGHWNEMCRCKRTKKRADLGIVAQLKML